MRKFAPIRFILAKFALIVLCGLLLPVAYSLNLPEKPNTRVVDLAHMLTLEQNQALNHKLDNIQGGEIEILTVDSLAGEPIDQFAINVARKWKLGQKDKNNGILIVIAKNEHQTRIEVGYGLEGEITDGFAGNLERQVLLPNFKSGNYYQGLNQTIDALVQKINGEPAHKINETNLQDAKEAKLSAVQNKSKKQDAFTEKLVILGAILGIIIACIVTGNTDVLLKLFWIIISIFIGRGGGGGNGNGNGSGGNIGGGGQFGGGGSSGKW